MNAINQRNTYSQRKGTRDKLLDLKANSTTICAVTAEII